MKPHGKLDAMALLSGPLVAALGFLVLVGWHLGSMRVVQVYLGFTLMAYNTAVSFVILGVALVALGRGLRVTARLGAGAAALILLLGTSTLLSRFTLPAAALYHPTPVAPNTGIALLCLAIAMLLLSFGTACGWRCPLAALLASAGSALGMNAVAGYVTGLDTPAWGHFTPMAAHTAIGLTVLGASVMLFSWRNTPPEDGSRALWLVAVATMSGVVTSVSFWEALQTVERAHLDGASRLCSGMPVTVLVLGLLVTALLGTAVYLAQTARLRLRLTERAERERGQADEMRFYLASIVDSTGDAIIGKDLDGVSRSWNAGAESLYWYSAEEITGQSITILCPRDRRDDPFEILRRVDRGEKVQRHEAERVRKDGRSVQVSLAVSPIRDLAGRGTGVSTVARDVTGRNQAEHALIASEALLGSVIDSSNGEIIGLVGVSRDITGQKQAEAARQESETAFRTLANLVPQMVWMCMPDGLNVYFNQRWVDYTGLTLEESHGRGWNTPFHADDKQAAWDAWNHATGTGAPYRVESRLRATDGSYRWFLVRGVPLRDAAGDVVKWFGTCTDIDDLKQAEQNLRKANEELEEQVQARTVQLHRSEERLTLALRASKVGVWDWNLETNAVWYSSRWKQMLGYTESDLEGRYTDWEQLLHPDDRARALTGIEAVLRGECDFDLEFRLRHKEGHYVAMLSRAVAVRREAGGPVVRIVGTHLDLTQQKQTEEALRQRTGDLLALNQELEAFNYSVSHDLRAPLRHIDGFSKILLQDYGPKVPEDARRSMERICGGAQRMGRMVDELLELSRTSRREVSKQLTGLGSLVEDVIEDLKPEIQDRNIEWRIADLPFADCDPILTRQVFGNLLSNAVKFSRTRKTAVIEVGQTEVDGQTVFFVRDNGVGFSMKYVGKLFGVFQRLHRREDFAGTGVGLVTVQRIVRKHGGSIWAEAELEKGATFYFTLEAPGQPGLEQPTAEPAALLAGER